MSVKFRNIKDLKVSTIGMGCMGFSHGYGTAPKEDYAIAAIRNAYDFGCTFFDTAEGYGKEQFYKGHNEQLLGKAVKPFRNNVVLATKLHISPAEISDKTLYKAVRRHLENSLKNLGTDYVDLYYLHRINEEIPVEEVASVMGQLIDDGLIRRWGLSQVSVDTLARADKITPVGAVQNLYSMVERDCEEEIFPYAMAHNIAVVPFSPIASGFLSGNVTARTKFEGDDVRKFVPQLSQENLAANRPVLDLLESYAKEKNATKAQISLAWMLHKYPNVVPIPGAKKQEHIIENLSAWNVSLTDKEFNDLETALNKIKIYGHRGHVETEQTSFGKNWEKK